MTKPTIDLGNVLKQLQKELLTRETPKKLLSDLVEHFKDSPRLLDTAIRSASEAIKESYNCCEQQPKIITAYDFETEKYSLIAYCEACKKDMVRL